MVENTIIIVNTEPYCVWEARLAERNLEFISGIDAEYYDYLCRLFLNSEDEMRSSIALRAAFHHAQETFFTLIGALLQAPQATYAWVARCSNQELRAIVKRICDEDESFYTRYKLKDGYVSWEAIAGIIFTWYQPGTEKQKNTIDSFAELWLRLSREFLDEHYVNEYNSIKHGFRIKSGGFTIAVGVEHEYGVTPPPSEMQVLGGSKHGTSFFLVNTVGGIKGNRSVTSRRFSINWKVEKVASLLQLLSISIANTTSALKILNGTPAAECQFFRPEHEEAFDMPWEHEPGVPWSNLDFVIDEKSIPVTTRKQLLEKLKMADTKKH